MHYEQLFAESEHCRPTYKNYIIYNNYYYLWAKIY